MLPIVVLDEAEDELTAAADRYEEQVPGLGADFRLEIDRALDPMAYLGSSDVFVERALAGFRTCAFT